MNDNMNFDKPQYRKLPDSVMQKIRPHDSPQLLLKCLERVREFDKPSSAESLVRKYSYAMAAVVMLAIFSAAYLNRVGGSSMNKDILQRTISAGLGVGSGASGESNGEKWIHQILRAPLQVKSIDSIRLENGRTIGRFIYTDGESDYIMLVAPGVDGCTGQAIPGAPGMKATEANGVNIISWCDGNIGYAFAGKKPVSTLLTYIK